MPAAVVYRRTEQASFMVYEGFDGGGYRDRNQLPLRGYERIVFMPGGRETR